MTRHAADGKGDAYAGIQIKEIAAALDQPAVRQRFVDIGCEAALLSPSAFADFIAAEYTKWARIVAAAKIARED